MPSWTPGIVPYGADQTVYIVVDSVDAKGSVRRETEIERADPETVICDLISGHFNDPLRVVAFIPSNTGQRTSPKISPRKSRPGSISTATNCPNTSATSSRVTGRLRVS